MRFRPNILILSLAYLLPACHQELAREKELQKAIISLQYPQRAPLAEKTLRQGGTQAVEELLWEAQAVGQMQALYAGILKVNCHFMLMSFAGQAYSDRAVPGTLAASLAVDIMSRRPEIAMEFAKSSNAFYRSMAMLSQCSNPPHALELSRVLENDKDSKVNWTVSAVLRNLEFNRGITASKERKKIKKLIDKTEVAETWNDDCGPQSKRVTSLVSNLQNGSYKSGRIENDSVHGTYIGVKRTDGRLVRLAPSCAIDVYKAATKKGLYLHWLLEPILYFGIPTKSQLSEAIDLLKRDMDKFPKEARNGIKASMVNAGADIDLKNMIMEPGQALEGKYIEAFARQNEPVAQKLIEKSLLCRGTFLQENLIESVGFLQSKPLLDQVYSIGTDCEHGLLKAFVALQRASDQRALVLLDQLLRKDFLEEKVLLAIQDNPTERTCAFIHERANSKVRHAMEILEKIGTERCPVKNTSVKSQGK